jgi:hypothetical protein
MSKRSTNENNYPFSWLDAVTEVTLNPEKSNTKSLTVTQLTEITERLPVETSRIITCIKTQAFCLYSTDQVKVVAGHYDQAVRVLIKQAQANMLRYPKTSALRETGRLILSALAELDHSIRNRYSSYLPEPAVPEADASATLQSWFGKVLCALSADQIGIILRAAFEVNLIIGPSFRKVCKAIAPYLSTPWKQDISWDTIRSNSGRPEQRDKEIAIQILEKMIEKIKGYR